jgi:hypothetical protein
MCAAVDRLKSSVDEKVYDLQPWQLWEQFGAVLHAARINAWQVLGHSQLPLKSLFPGAVVNGCERKVKLRPVEVFACQSGLQERGFGNFKVQQSGNASFVVSWLERGFVVLNGDSGRGLDVFFALELVDSPGKYCVFVDQRKRVAGSLGPCAAKTLLEKARGDLKTGGRVGVLAAGLFNTLPNRAPGAGQLPMDSVVVSFHESAAYHGTLRFHPASTPLVSVNDDNKTALRLVFGGSVASAAVIGSIIERRTSERFSAMDDLRQFIHGLDTRVDVTEEMERRLRFG